MIQQIETVEHVEQFFNHLLEESLNFHPDEDFNNYINVETKQPSYTTEEAEVRNELMIKSFEVCEKNDVSIYDLSQTISLKYTGLDKFFK